METKRCIYVDDDKQAQSGIYCSNGDGNDFIICECCGGIVDPSEVQHKVLENWVDAASPDMVYCEIRPRNSLQICGKLRN